MSVFTPFSKGGCGQGNFGVTKRKSDRHAPAGDQVRLLDLSRELGVSLTTISRALRDKQGMSEETRERIKQAAARHGYVPNQAGASLSTGRVFSVGYIIPKMARGPLGQMQGDVMRGMIQELAKFGYSLTVFSEDYFTAGQRSSLLDAVRRLRVDALAMTIEHNERVPPPSAPLPFPLVVINRRVEGIDANFVLADEERGGELAVEHLIDCGHRRIAYIGGPPENASLSRRQDGYRSALAAAGVSMDPRLVVHASGIDWHAGQSACASLLDAAGEPATAIFCSSDILAFGVLKCLEERGISVPDDMAVCSFDDSMLADMTAPALTSVRKQREAMGVEAARLLIGRLKGNVVPSEVVLPVSLIVRGSSGGVTVAPHDRAII